MAKKTIGRLLAKFTLNNKSIVKKVHIIEETTLFYQVLMPVEYSRDFGWRYSERRISKKDPMIVEDMYAAEKAKNPPKGGHPVKAT